MYVAKISPEEKISVATKVGRSKDAHKVKRLISSVLFIAIHSAHREESQPVIALF